MLLILAVGRNLIAAEIRIEPLLAAREDIGAEYAGRAVKLAQLSAQQDIEILARLQEELEPCCDFVIAFKRILGGAAGQDIVDIVALPLVKHREPGRHRVARNRPADRALCVQGIEAAIGDAAISAQFVPGLHRIKLHDARRRVAAEQGALRPAQHFDTVKVEYRKALQDRVFKDDIVIDEADWL